MNKNQVFLAKLITAGGEESDVTLPGGDISAISELLGCKFPDISRLQDGVLIVDDDGIRKALPQNERASALYGGPIFGDALWFTHKEFAAFDSTFG